MAQQFLQRARTAGAPLQMVLQGPHVRNGLAAEELYQAVVPGTAVHWLPPPPALPGRAVGLSVQLLLHLTLFRTEGLLFHLLELCHLLLEYLLYLLGGHEDGRDRQ